jgi:hypothetical protein
MKGIRENGGEEIKVKKGSRDVHKRRQTYARIWGVFWTSFYLLSRFNFSVEVRSECCNYPHVICNLYQFKWYSIDFSLDIMLLIYKDYLVCTTISISLNYCDRNTQLCRHDLLHLIYVTATIFNTDICPTCLLESVWHDKRIYLWILSLPQHINMVKGEISTLYQQLSSSFRFRFTNRIH